MAQWRGTDISVWQASTPAGKAFYMIRAGIGMTKDTRLDQHYNQIKAWGKPYGFYYYPKPYKFTAEQEAEFFYSLVGHHAGKALFALDWEQKSLNAGPDWARKFLDKFYELSGVRAMIYIQGSAVGGYQKVLDGDYGLWIAHWGVNSPTISPWKFFAMWQFTSNDGKLDEDYWCNDSQETWNKYCACDKEVSAEEPEPPHQVDEAEEIKNSGVMDLVYRTMKNDFGTLDERKAALGSRYDEVQSLINYIQNTDAQTLADEVWRDKYGGGEYRATVLGDRYAEVMAIVNQGNVKYYYVKSGDTLSTIAAKFGTTVSQLVSWNKIANQDYIQAGWKLRVA